MLRIALVSIGAVSLLNCTAEKPKSHHPRPDAADEADARLDGIDAGVADSDDAIGTAATDIATASATIVVRGDDHPDAPSIANANGPSYQSGATWQSWITSGDPLAAAREMANFADLSRQCPDLERVAATPPTIISTPEDLTTLTSGHHYQLANSVTLTGIWLPLPRLESVVIDGRGFSIVNLAIETWGESISPVSGMVTEFNCSLIKDLQLDEPRLTLPLARTAYAGPLAGGVTRTMVHNVRVAGTRIEITGNPSSDWYVGIGALVGTAWKSSFKHVVIVDGMLTGLAGGGGGLMSGACNGILVEDSFNGATINLPRAQYVGGILSGGPCFYVDITVSRTINLGAITGGHGIERHGYAGGLIAFAGDTAPRATDSLAVAISDSMNAGPVACSQPCDAGGLVGAWQVAIPGRYRLSNSYNRGSIGGDGARGGLVGHVTGSIDGVSNVFVQVEDLQGKGGGDGTLNGVRGVTFTALQTSTPFTGWDFDHTWIFDPATGYPTLRP